MKRRREGRVRKMVREREGDVYLQCRRIQPAAHSAPRPLHRLPPQSPHSLMAPLQTPNHASPCGPSSCATQPHSPCHHGGALGRDEWNERQERGGREVAPGEREGGKKEGGGGEGGAWV